MIVTACTYTKNVHGHTVQITSNLTLAHTQLAQVEQVLAREILAHARTREWTTSAHHAHASATIVLYCTLKRVCARARAFDFRLSSASAFIPCAHGVFSSARE